jgi:hypothetical protein
MRGRLVLAGLGVFAAFSLSLAQLPPQAPLPQAPLPPAQSPPQSRPLTPPIQIPRLPEPQPRPLPHAMGQPTPLTPTLPGLPDGSTLPPPTEVVLPYPEDKFPLDTALVSFKRINGSWQVWAGQRMLRDLGNDETGAKDVVRTLRDLRPTEWARIGSPRPVVEYGLINGRPPIVAAFPKMVVPVDMKSVRVESVRGAWCLRDDNSILFNFGSNRPDADQALAVIHKYGFNRVGLVGSPAVPAMAYFFSALESDKSVRPAGGTLTAAMQENALTRTGIPVPGVGYIGEMIKIDPRKVEAHQERGEWVVAYGPDVLGRFGPWEWVARDAVRAIQDGKFTEFCKFGSTGIAFFLSNGKAPTKVPFSAQGRRFNLADLKAQPINDRWAVTEGGRHLFDVGGPEEGEQLIRLLRHFQFDQLCLLGQTPRAGLQFLARSR